jgi:hypothetical protein
MPTSKASKFHVSLSGFAFKHSLHTDLLNHFELVMSFCVE